MVFQNPALYPHLSVSENIAFALRARRLPRTEVRSRVARVAGMLGLSSLLSRRPRALSGGERQRVALGRALARQPSVLLLDEPFSSLDPPLRADLRERLLEFHHDSNTTILLVTHDQAEAMAIGDTVGLMDHGRIIQSGAPRELYDRPRNRFVADFIGVPPMSILRCEIEENPAGCLVRYEKHSGVPLFALASHETWISRARQSGSVLELGIRPEHVTLRGIEEERESATTWLGPTFDVTQVEYLGHEVVVTLRFGPGSLRARVPAGVRVELRDQFWIGIDLERAYWFDPKTGEALGRDASN
jgi:ABC-type sugar transport system ATPase subunit